MCSASCWSRAVLRFGTRTPIRSRRSEWTWRTSSWTAPMRWARSWWMRVRRSLRGGMLASATTEAREGEELGLRRAGVHLKGLQNGLHPRAVHLYPGPQPVDGRLHQHIPLDAADGVVAPVAVPLVVPQQLVALAEGGLEVADDVDERSGVPSYLARVAHAVALEGVLRLVDDGGEDVEVLREVAEFGPEGGVLGACAGAVSAGIVETDAVVSVKQERHRAVGCAAPWLSDPRLRGWRKVTRRGRCDRASGSGGTRGVWIAHGRETSDGRLTCSELGRPAIVVDVPGDLRDVDDIPRLEGHEQSCLAGGRRRRRWRVVGVMRATLSSLFPSCARYSRSDRRGRLSGGEMEGDPGNGEVERVGRRVG